MSLNRTEKQLGLLSVIIYDFEEVGDVLPMHNHDFNTVHITIVARGDFTICGIGWKKDLSSGAVIDFKENQKHEFISRSANSRIVNIIKNI